MPGPCVVCVSPDRVAIEQSLATGGSATTLARLYQVTRDQLNWHRRRHTPVKPGPPSVSPALQSAPPTPSLTSSPATASAQTAQTSAASSATETALRARKRFLTSLAAYGNVSWAAKAARIGRATVYRWQEHDPEFAHDMRMAEIQATETLEREAWRRAREGTAEPVYQHGKQVGTIQRYSDNLLMFLLKARAPERYRDRVDVSVTPVIKVVAGFDPASVV